VVEKRLTGSARKLRGDPTEAEKALWTRLRTGQIDGLKFVRQFPIGTHVADFACRGATSDSDAARTALIEAHGYRVIRFWNHDVLANTDGVVETIRSELRLSPNLLP
jgi:very-short-patch-repair endonuclease